MSAAVSIAMQKCRRCGAVDALTRTVCSQCLGAEFDPVAIAGSGTLVSWTTIRRAPTQFRDEVPYDVCVVDLVDGQRITGRLAVDDGARVGVPVVAMAMRGDTPVFSILDEAST